MSDDKLKQLREWVAELGITEEDGGMPIEEWCRGAAELRNLEPITIPIKKRIIKDIVLVSLINGDKFSAKVTFLEFRRSAMGNENGLARYFYDKKPAGHYTHDSSETFIVPHDFVSIINWLKKDGYEADQQSLSNIGDGRVVTFMLREEVEKDE